MYSKERRTKEGSRPPHQGTVPREVLSKKTAVHVGLWEPRVEV